METRERAEAMARAFITKQRTSSGEDYDTLDTEHAAYGPWMVDACQAAHRDEDGDLMLPDDHRYAMIREFVQTVSEQPDARFEDIIEEYEPDVYDSDRHAWLDSHSYRTHYCDQAAAELGGEPTTSERIGYGMIYEYAATARALIESLDALTICDECGAAGCCSDGTCCGSCGE